MRVLVSLSMALFFFGCSQRKPDPVPVEAEASVAKPFIWTTENRPYRVVKLNSKDACRIGVRHHQAWIVVEYPDSKDEVEAAAREVYNELKDNIEFTCPDAEHKLLTVAVFDDHRDVGHGMAILLVRSPESLAGPKLDSWENVDKDWHWWRDPTSRPSAGELAIFYRYRELTYDKPKLPGVNQIRVEFQVTTEAIARILAKVWVWRNGNPQTEEAIERQKQNFLDEWDQYG